MRGSYFELAPSSDKKVAKLFPCCRLKSYIIVTIHERRYLYAGWWCWGDPPLRLLHILFPCHIKLFNVLVMMSWKHTYRISSYSFRGNYSFLNLEIVANSNSCRNIYIFYLINWFFAAETIQGRKLFKGGNYMRKYGT